MRVRDAARGPCQAGTPMRRWSRCWGQQQGPSRPKQRVTSCSHRRLGDRAGIRSRTAGPAGTGGTSGGSDQCGGTPGFPQAPWGLGAALTPTAQSLQDGDPRGRALEGRAVPCSHRPVLPASGSDSCPELPRGRRGDLPPPSRPTGNTSSLPAFRSSFRPREGDNRAHSLTFLNQRKHGDLK